MNRRPCLEEDVDGAVEAVGDEAGVVGEQLGEGDELGRQDVGVERHLREVAIEQLSGLALTRSLCFLNCGLSLSNLSSSCMPRGWPYRCWTPTPPSPS